MAIWVMPVVAVAPCQCFSLGENQITSPGLIVSTGPALTLDPAAASHNNQRLTQRMRMPRSAGAWLERDAGTGYTGRLRRAEQAVNPHPAGKVVFRAFA